MSFSVNSNDPFPTYNPYQTSGSDANEASGVGSILQIAFTSLTQAIGSEPGNEKRAIQKASLGEVFGAGGIGALAGIPLGLGFAYVFVLCIRRRAAAQKAKSEKISA